MPSNIKPASAGAAYDETPYAAASHPLTHPNRLAAIARLFGVAAAVPSRARVLELGCADGSNLLPMADQYPDARFLGIDASQVQIAEAQKAISAAGLRNIELRHQDILEFPETEGAFDYIIVHGVFSWVPDPVRRKIFEICDRQLTEHGVAYVSYNALPGWNMRRTLRDMVLYHTRPFPEGKIKVAQARALLGFVSDAVANENSAYSILLRSEVDAMRSQPDGYVRHDILEEENTAFYFNDFMTLATQHRLQYLGEPALAQMLTSNFSEKVYETLNQLSTQIVQQEQYMDFLRNRTFRQTLLCRSNLAIQRNIKTDGMETFAFRSRLKPIEGPIDLSVGVNVSFPGFGSATVNSADSYLKAVFQTLAETAGNSAISFRNLLDLARLRSRPVMGRVPPDRDRIDEDTLRKNLLAMLAKGIVDLYAEPVTTIARVPEKPRVSPLVLHQATNARYLTDRMHEALPADVLGRYVISLCDGTRTRDEIVDAMVTYVRQDKIAVQEGDQPIKDVQRVREILSPRADLVLNRLAAHGFFVP